MPGTSSRLLQVLSLLQTHRLWAGPVLAERLAVSERTLRRDVERLRELGYAIEAFKGPDGGYQLTAGTDLPPLLLDDDQAVAVTLALQSGVAPGTDEAAERALATLRRLLPSRLRHRLEALASTALPTTASPLPTDTLLAVGSAVRAQQVLRLEYRGEERRVEPHHLVSRAGRWYLVAWDLDRDDWRTFRVDRIEPRSPTGPRFSPRLIPGHDVAAFVAGRFKGSETTDEWPCLGSVVVHLPASTVRPFVGDGVVTELDGSSCRVRQGSWSWTALAASFGRFDADLEQAEPEELAEAFTVLARRMARSGSRP